MTSETFFEQIAQQLNKKLPFVVYRKPDKNGVKALLQNSNDLHIVDDYSEKGFVFAPFDDSKDAILIPIKDSEPIESDFVISNTSEKHKTIFQDIDPSKQQHISLVKKGIEAINNGKFQKVVLSRCEHVEISEENPIHFFKHLLQNYPTAFVYCWYHPKIGLWLGATPETLIKMEGFRFKTMALAGTQKFDGKLNVTWQEKEKDEQQFVTDFIVNNLQNSVTNLNVSDVETVRAGNLLHLKTNITGILNFESSNFQQLLNSLHPTPAVCGLPKEKAKSFILKNETYNREFYTGFLGELNLQETTTRNSNKRNVENNAYTTIKKVSNLYVNLRCMQIHNQKALIYIGGGITIDSNPQAEWEETVSKSEVMKKVLH